MHIITVIEMSWRGGYGGGRGRWMGLWPGRGPFNYLPPWYRPGWVFGRGRCWWFFNPYMWGVYYPYKGYTAYSPYVTSYTPSIYPYYPYYVW
jgi:hypothetical protein